MAKKQAAKELVSTTGQLPDAHRALFEEHKDTFDQSELAIPFIRLLQDLSPQVKSRDPEYIEGAQPGMILLQSSGQLIDGEKGINIVPIMKQRSITEWVPRKEGGGFIADHGNDLSVLEDNPRNEEGKRLTPDGHEIVDAMQYFVLIITDEGIEQAVLNFGGMSWKAARQWNTFMANTLKVMNGDKRVPSPPTFAGVYNLTTRPDSNDKGDFFVYNKPAFVGFTSEHDDADEIFGMCSVIREGLKSGKIKAKVDDEKEPWDE